MIRVHAVFPNYNKKREIAIQTQLPLPRIENYLTRTVKGRGKHGNSDSGSFLKNTKYGFFGREGGRQQSIISIGSPKKAAGRNQNLCPNEPSSKIQTKAFKFLKFQQDLLRNATLKHLDGRRLTRQQHIKLKQKMVFSFISTNLTAIPNKLDEDLGTVQIPEEEHIEVTLEELIHLVKELYIQLEMQSRRNNNIMLHALHRNITQVVQSLVSQRERPLYSPQISTIDRKQILSNYIKRYIDEIWRNKNCFSQNSNKAKLMGFYMQIYKRYEAVPFSEEIYEPLIVPVEKQYNQVIKSPTSPIPWGKSTLCDESFLKLRFYNNLRKEVQMLNEDTQKIMQEESSKMGHS